MFPAGFDNLAGKALSNFNCLGDAAPFCDQSGNIRTSTQIAPFFEHLDSDTDSNFFNFRDVLLPFHGRLFSFHRTTVCCMPVSRHRRFLAAFNSQLSAVNYGDFLAPVTQ